MSQSGMTNSRLLFQPEATKAEEGTPGGFGIAFLLVLASGRGPHAPELAVAGAIVGLLGLGNLVYYFIARGRKPSEPVGRT